MFGQRAGRSVFNTPTRFTHFRPIFGLLFENRRRYADGPLLPCTPFFCGRASRDGGRTRFFLAIVHAWSAWRALQRCVPHRRQRSSSLACSLLRPEGHLSEVYVVKQKKYVRGGASATRPALPRQSSASGREIAEKGRLAGHIGLVFHIGAGARPRPRARAAREES